MVPIDGLTDGAVRRSSGLHVQLHCDRYSGEHGEHPDWRYCYVDVLAARNLPVMDVEGAMDPKSSTGTCTLPEKEILRAAGGW